MEDHGAFLNPNLIVTDISPTTLSRGLTAVAPIRAGEALFKIPGPILFTDAKVLGWKGEGRVSCCFGVFVWRRVKSKVQGTTD